MTPLLTANRPRPYSDPGRLALGIFFGCALLCGSTALGGCTGNLNGPSDGGSTDVSVADRTSVDAGTDLGSSDVQAADAVADAPADGLADVPAPDAGRMAPTSGFCACSRDNPADNAGSFEMCAEVLADGAGTYYELGPYARTPDADERPGIPRGTITEHRWDDSTIYPGTRRRYWVYVPGQYDGTSPAALLVLTDGDVYQRGDGNYRTGTVLDNLIEEGAMPVTIAVFVDPGMFDGGNSNRSNEYDKPDDNYVRFLLEELLPAALEGYSVSEDPRLRAIGGRSSGGSAAFTACWERPDQFGLAYTTIGSFVRLNANAAGEFSDVYPSRIDETDPRKAIRLTLLSGANDLDNEYGNWRDAHMAMTTALDCAGYTYRSGFGESEHGDHSHPRAQFGNDLRWLFATAPSD